MKQTTSLFKRIACAFLALVLAFGLLPVTAPHAHAAETDEYTYSLKFGTKYCGTATDEGHLDITKNDDNHAKGKKLTVTATVTDSTGTKVDSDAWVGVLRGAYTLDSDFTEAEVLYSYTVAGKTSGGTAHNGGAIPIGNKSIALYADEYSLVLFKDSTVDEPARVITFTITWDNIEETITTQPTCTTEGVKHQVYVGAYQDKNETKQWEYDVSIPALGHDVDFTEVANTDTHTGTCKRDGCGEPVTEACTFDENHVCTVCGGLQELYTDKTVYKYGEPILVTVNQYGDDWDWIGIYKKGEAYDPNAGGSKSIYWYYVYDPGMSASGVNILETRDENGRSSEFVAGEYTIVFFPYGYYTPGATVDITVTTEIDPSKTVTVPATCEEDGSETYYNTDGTVARFETIPALNHDYETLRPVFDEENLQHTYVCNNDNTHQYSENCTWDEGIVVEEPAEGQDGKKEFTCTVCGGHRYEKYNGKEVVSEEITKPATCEESGIKLVTYSDGSTEEVEIPKLNHDWNEWTFNEETKQHERTCKNDTACLDTEDCSFTASAVSGGTRYTCGTCQGHYDVIILSTDKTEYALGEPILVTVNSDVYDETATDWIGIWEGNHTYTDGVSIYYYYPSAQGWSDFNIYNSAYHQRDSIVVGEYVIRLFTADSYTEITNVKITVGPAVRDESKTVRVEPTCETDGSITYYLTNGEIDEVITAEQDASLKATGHAYPETWNPNSGTETHSRVCANDPNHVETDNCQWDEGVETEAPTAEKTGIMLHTCTVCGNTKEEIIPALTAEIVSQETVAPTCEEKGYTLVTYSDGSTRKIDYVDALGHDFGGVYTRVEGTHTHSQDCQRENCDEVEITECHLEVNGVLTDGSYYYSCTKCGEWEEPVIITDKEVYAAGEDIIITIHPQYAATMSSKDWIGLYHKGETPSASGVTSIRWNYATDFVDGMSIFQSSNHDRPEEDPDNVLKAGQYVLYLCANDGYSIQARTTITIVTEEDPSKTVQVDPTCTEDGTITYYNTDGTVSRVVTAAEDENLKAHGHTYGDWVYNGVEKQTHTHSCICAVCAEPCDHSETAPCEWDEGEVTLEPTEELEGVKTYTCTVCNGTKEEVLPKVNVTVTGTETVDATCEEPGYIRTFYSDGSHSDEVIPAKGHAYGDWVYDAETKHHKKTCANDSNHVISEACTMEKLVVDNSVNYTCSVCEGGYVTGLVETDKSVYGVTDPIMVTVHDTFSGAWVGLYKEGELFDPNNGGVASLFWSYITEDMVGNAFDITAVTAGNNSGYRGEKLANGKYVLVFFGDSGYSNVLNRVEIEVFTDMSNAEFELRFYKDLPRENGWHTRFELKNVDNPSGGEKVTVCGAVLSGEAGSSWLGVFEGDYNLETDFDGMTPLFSKYISDFNNTKVSLNWPAKGGFEFYVGNFTVVIFADASTNYPVKYITFEVYRPIVEGSEVILREPTCETPGLKMLDYVDDNKEETQDEGVMVEIAPLGHLYGEWTCVEGTNTHSRTCSRENCGNVENESCVFENGVCAVCEGIEYHIHALTRVPAVAATCTTEGNIEYYTCVCDEWFADADATQPITDKTSVVVPAGHTLTEVPAKAAGCTANGNTKYYTCECGKWFKDADAAQEITDKNSVVIPAAHTWTPATCAAPKTCSVCQATEGAALSHNYGAWVFDAAAKTHTHTCANDAKHTETKPCTFGEAEVIKEAVGNNKGVKQYTCTVCGGSFTEEYTAEVTDAYERIYGADRYQTAIAVAEQLKENLGIEKFQTIVVASGNEFADALSGTYLANQKNAPVLLVRQQSMDSVKEYIKNNLVSGGTVYILGGTKAVPASMESGLEGFNVKRLGGSDRYETNLLILKEAGVARGQDILVCTGKNFADTLSASAVNKPILMVKDNLYSNQKNYLSTVGGGKLYIIGGKAAVTEKLAGELAAYGTTQRIEGATRYETSVNVAKTFFAQTDYAVLAYGNNFPDGLCGGALAYSMGAPLLLVTNDKYGVAEQYAENNDLVSGVVLGGAGLIKNSVAEKIFITNNG